LDGVVGRVVWLGPGRVVGAFDVFYTQSFPVEVLHATSTSFEFVAIAGHPEGEGRTIAFSFCDGSNGDTMLNIDTSSDGSLVTDWWGVRNADFFIAHRTWSEFAGNIRANYDFMISDGYRPPEVI
jgi:hypothetical protein